MDAYDISDAFEAIEQELIDSMIRNMVRHRVEEINEGKQWTMWQTEQLKALELYKLENQKKYKKEFKSINDSIDVLIKQSRATGSMNQEIDILRAVKNGFKPKRMTKSLDIDGAFFKLNTRKLEKLIQATKSDLRKVESAMLRMANDQYRKVIFNAQMYANTGSGTYDKAIDMATRDFRASGINCVEYSNGRRVNIASYSEMAIRTASKRAYLYGEGEKRKEWGISTVIVNQRGFACLKCLRFVGKIFIDDVWGGGSASDGDYPLLSTALADGLYHPNCKDSHTTYFEGITTVPDKMTTSQLEQAKKNYMLQQEQRYNERMVRKYSRMRDGSLDEESKKRYDAKVKAWKTRNKTLIENNHTLLRENPSRYKTRGLQSISKNDTIKVAKESSLESRIQNFLDGTNTDKEALGKKILAEYHVENVPVHIKEMTDYGYCGVEIGDNTLTVMDYNLNINDKRSAVYQVKTAFHEAYHASGNGYATDYGRMVASRWLDLEETFAESTSHYMSQVYGITDLTPSYPDKLVKMLPRLKKLPDFSECSTISDFGKVALELRQNGGGSAWKQLSQSAMREKIDFGSYIQQYFPDIRKDMSGYVDKILENMPENVKYRDSMIIDIEKAMENIETHGFTLSDNQYLMLNNAVAVAMNRIGVK